MMLARHHNQGAIRIHDITYEEKCCPRNSWN
jgi:hypothetical protein